MKNSKIEWTHHTFNPWWGCVKVSPACEHCYAEAFAKRTGHDVWGPNKPRRFFGDAHWQEPLKWNAEADKNLLCADCAGDRWGKATGGSLGGPCMKCGKDAHVHELSVERQRVFCASMADVFEAYEGPSRVELASERSRLWKLIESTPNLDWLLLTKRPENILKMVPSYWAKEFPHNVWPGTTVENQEQASKRIPELLKVPARIRFLSMEPLLEEVDLTHPDDRFLAEYPRIHWIICGGESGPGARPMHPEWARSLRDQCSGAGVPFFFKQWGDWLPSGQDDAQGRNQCTDEDFVRVGKAKAGRLLDGKEWNEIPS